MQLVWMGKNGRKHVTPVEGPHEAARLIARDQELRSALELESISWLLEEYCPLTRSWVAWRATTGETDPIKYAEENPEPPQGGMEENEFRIHVLAINDEGKTNLYRVWSDAPEPYTHGLRSYEEFIAEYILETDFDLRKAIGLEEGDVQALAIGAARLRPGRTLEEDDKVDIEFRLIYKKPLTEAQLLFLKGAEESGDA